MALQAFHETFTVSTGSVGTTQSRTGYGFQPKALLVWNTLNQSATDVVTGGLEYSVFGVATSVSSRRCVMQCCADGGASSDTASGTRDDAIVGRVSNGASFIALLDVDSIDSDGWTAIVDDTYTAGEIIHVLALGGDDITDTGIVELQASTSEGTQAITGLGFQPDCVIILSISTVSSGTDLETGAKMSIGICSGATAAENACMVGVAADGQNPTVAKSYCRNGESLVGVTSAGALDGRGYISSLDSDGFTITWNSNPSSGYYFYALAIKGGSFSVGDVLTQTDTSTAITESGLTFQPVAGLLLSACNAESSAGNLDANMRQSIGAFTSSSNQTAASTSTLDAVTPAVSARGVEFDSAYLNISSSDTIDGTMGITSVNSDGYSALMSDADPSQSFIAHLLFGSAASASQAHFDGKLSGGFQELSGSLQ